MLGSVACDDPTATRPAQLDPGLQLLLILDPDRSTQALAVQSATVGTSPLATLEALVTTAGVRTTTASSPEPFAPDELLPCIAQYGALVNEPRCLVLPLRPRPGMTYRVDVAAQDRPIATATTTVPGDFRILSAEVNGTPPGALEVRLTWSRSEDVHRYVIAIRAQQDADGGFVSCSPDYLCYDRWWAVTGDTSLVANVSSRSLENTRGPYVIDVYAMNRDVYGMLMTGAVSAYFPVPPAQNVEGGYGGVGAWVRRSLPVQ